MGGERGGAGDHAPLKRGVLHYAPEVEHQGRRPQRPVSRSGRLDETYVNITGRGASLDRAVAKEGQTSDFLLRPQRDKAAAEAGFRQAIRTQGVPEKLRLDQRGSTPGGP